MGEASNPGPPKSQFQRRGPVTRPHRSRSRVEPTIYSSDDDDEPLVPVLADSMSTVPASSRATSVGAQPTRMAEAFDLTIVDSDLSESPAVQASRGRRRVIREDSSEDEGPGPNLLRRGRFAVLADNDTESVDVHSHAEEEATQDVPARRRRRLRILWQEPTEVERVPCAPTQIEPDSQERLARVSAHIASSCESDSGRSGASEADADPESEVEALVEPVNVNLRARAVTSGFESLDIVDLTDVFQFKASIMQSVPKFLHGAYRSALRQAIDGVKSGLERNDVVLQVRAWKLFLLVPRMLLFRPCRGGLIPRKTIEERVALFQSGHWDVLVEMSLDASMQAATVRSRRKRRDLDSVEKRARRALRLVQLGEVSAGRQALEGASVAPGTNATLRAFQDPDRRPKFPREPVPDEIASFEPAEEFVLDQDWFSSNLRKARRGAAAGPSGMNADHLRPMLENSADSVALSQLASFLCKAKVPNEILGVMGQGRITALEKADGGIRGIVVGEIFRGVAARTIAQQYTAKAEEATAPHQYALKTKAGCETVAHILKVLTELDENATVVSVDGIGAFDLISRNSMMRGLRHMVDGEKILPFVRAFYGKPSSYWWEDDVGDVHAIQQGEGGEQGDPLMPILFCLGQHAALASVKRELLEGEQLFAFLDDLYIICKPERVVEVHRILSNKLWEHARISLHAGKTKVWNKSGVEPKDCHVLQEAAVLATPGAVVWRGDRSLPTCQQGFKVLGVPFGHQDFISSFLRGKIASHQTLLDRIPEVPDVQSAWLLLSYCAAARANFFLRSVDPDESEEFAQAHDEGVWRCFSRIMGLSPSCDARIQASLPLCEGGLGLRSAMRSRPAAHWASWADALKMIKQRHPGVADMIVRSLVSHENCSSIQSLLRCADALETAGFDVPSWEDLAEGRRPEGTSEDGDPCQPRIGWQKQAATCLEKQFLSRDVWPGLLDHERAMLLSQQGPMASVPFSFPTDRVSRFDSQPFRILLSRRLRLSP